VPTLAVALPVEFHTTRCRYWVTPPCLARANRRSVQTS